MDDAEMINKLTRKFWKRLRVSENTSKEVACAVERRRLHRQENSAAPQPEPCGAQRLIERLRRKEKEQVDKILKERDQIIAQRKKTLIESMLPAQRRHYVLELEQRVSKNQHDAKIRHRHQVEEERRAREAD